MRMFVRKKKNRSGATSMVVVEKSNGVYHEIRTIGTSKDDSEVESFVRHGKKRIEGESGTRDIFEVFAKENEEKQVTEYLFSNIESVLLNGTQLILNQVFRIIGFESLGDEILKQLVIARLSQPMSKLATADYLKSHFYSGLWVIERAFRISKGTIELRPMFHFNPKRIEAHVCLCFVAYKVYKELERILRVSHIDLSVDKVLGIAKTITTIRIRLPISENTMAKTMLLTKSHKSIATLFDETFWEDF